MDNTLLLVVVLIFVAVVLLLEGGYLVWNSYKGPEAARIERRLRAMSAAEHASGEMTLLKQRLLSGTPLLQRLLLALPRAHALDRWLLQAGLSLSVGTMLLLSLLCAALAMLLAWWLHAPLLPSLLLAALATTVPWLLVLRQRQRRMQRFEAQLPEALEMMCRALRAGHALPQSLKMVGDELADPVGGEFRTTFDEVNYGFSLQEAMLNLATRIDSTDLRYMVIAVLIQRETGGNLAELLGNISSLIRGRIKLYGAIRVLSAEGRLSAWILTLLPFSVAGVIQLINPGFLKVLWEDGAGLQMASGMLLMMVLGIVWMRQIIRIRV